MDEHGARKLRRFAEEAGRGLRGLDASVWRNRIEDCRRELEAAFDWLLDHDRASDALAMACTLAEFLRITDRVATGRRWLDRALAAAPTNDHLRAVGLYERGMLAFWQGDDEDACSLHGRSLQLARRLGDPTAVALALCGLARVALREDLDWARTLCEEALQTVEATDDRLGRANALHVLGVAAQMQGDLEQARDLMTRRIEAARQLGDYLAVSSECTNLSMVERQLGNLGRAERLAAEALRIEERRGDDFLNARANAPTALARMGGGHMYVIDGTWMFDRETAEEWRHALGSFHAIGGTTVLQFGPTLTRSNPEKLRTESRGDRPSIKMAARISIASSRESAKDSSIEIAGP